MLTQEDDVEAHALRREGWTISAIAKHLRHDTPDGVRNLLVGTVRPFGEKQAG